MYSSNEDTSGLDELHSIINSVKLQLQRDAVVDMERVMLHRMIRIKRIEFINAQEVQILPNYVPVVLIL